MRGLLHLVDIASLKSLGRTSLLCEHKNKFWPIEFEVLDNVSNVLGLTASTEMKLVQRVETLANDILRKYADTFSGLGCITDVEYHIQLDPTHRPVIHPPRRVPVKLRSKLKEELLRMERLGVIEPVREPTDWVSSLVTVTKPNGSLRVCIDPRDLNKAIKCEHFPMPTITSEVAFQSRCEESGGNSELCVHFCVYVHMCVYMCAHVCVYR